MIVKVFSDAGALLWKRQHRDGETPSGMTAANYVEDGTQQKIIAALIDALGQARGQLRGFALQIVDAVADVCPSAAKIDGGVPISIARNRDASREPIKESAVILMTAAAPETMKI